MKKPMSMAALLGALLAGTNPNAEKTRARALEWLVPVNHTSGMVFRQGRATRSWRPAPSRSRHREVERRQRRNASR